MKHPEAGNLFDTRHAFQADAETVEHLLDGNGIRIERILSAGQRTAEGEWFDQDWDEWVALLQGTATLSFADGARSAMQPGDWILLPAHRRHRVEETSASPPCIWLAVHVKPIGLP